MFRKHVGESASYDGEAFVCVCGSFCGNVYVIWTGAVCCDFLRGLPWGRQGNDRGGATDDVLDVCAAVWWILAVQLGAWSGDVFVDDAAGNSAQRRDVFEVAAAVGGVSHVGDTLDELGDAGV